MYFVYILSSTSYPGQTYIGFTEDVEKRLAKHNEGGCTHTSKFKPWKLDWYGAFPDKHKALQFETYLKSHSGKAFRTKRLV